MILLLFSILCLSQAKNLPSLGDMEPGGTANNDRNNEDIFGEIFRAISREMNEQNLCVEDNPNRLLQKEISVRRNSPSKCIEACKEAGYLLAGVKYSYQCFCGNSPPPWSVECLWKHHLWCWNFYHPCSCSIWSNLSDFFFFEIFFNLFFYIR